jgi:hypothetical protein
VPSGVLAFAGVAFADVGAFGAAGAEEDAPAALSFFGTLLTGAAAGSVALVAAAAGFLTGVALDAVEVAVFAGAAAGFFAACPVLPATFDMLPTLAVNDMSAYSSVCYCGSVHWSASFCFLS